MRTLISAQAEDSQQKIYPLPVEAVRSVPNFPPCGAPKICTKLRVVVFR
ncbi:MAG TPA: hypothetical protein VLB46_17410 [Pyrinomonadaceae bacterium]|nr:hypothetical protein [Pyrinomonadaceae bacterium]